MPIRILIVDDHSIVRQGIISLLEDEEDIIIAGEASDGDQVGQMIENVNPDLLLLDLTMPNMSGTEVLKQIMPGYANVRTLVFSMHNNADYILSSVQNGASGYLLKDTGREEILTAIRSIFKGELYFPPAASSIIIKSLMKQINRLPEPKAETNESDTGNVWKVISPREQQILKCITEGMSSKEIADKFEISVNTVANQRASIMKKLNVKNTAELISLTLK